MNHTAWRSPSGDRRADTVHAPSVEAKVAPDATTDGATRRSAVIIDDLALVRHGVRAVLEPLDYDVVAETHAARDAAAVASARVVDVAVVRSPADEDAPDAVRRLKAVATPPAVVVLVPPRRHDGVAALLRAGGDVLVPRSVRPTELVDAVAAAVAGTGFVAPVLQRSLVGAGAPGRGTDGG